jgi:hypothetical protein
MEHRDDLEQLLLSGLPEDERHQTQQSMDQATRLKLQRLRQGRSPELDSLEEDQDEFAD